MWAAALQKLLRWVVLPASLFIVVLLSLLHVPRIQRAILDRALRIDSPVRAEVGQFSFNLFRRTASIRDLIVRNAAGDPAFFAARELDVSWKYSDLSRGLAGLAIRGSGITLDLARLPDGRLNLPASEGGGDALPAPDFLGFDDVHLLYSDASVSACLGPLRLELIDGALALNQERAGTVDIGPYAASITTLSAAGTLTELSLAGIQANGEIAIAASSLPEVGSATARTSFALTGSDQRLVLRGLELDSERFLARGQIGFSLDEGPSEATITARGEGITAAADLKWRGFDIVEATGAATVTASREDVRGTAAVGLDRNVIRVSAGSIETFGAKLSADLRMVRSDLRLSGSVGGVYPFNGNQLAFRADVSGTATGPLAAISANADGLSAGPLSGATLTATADASLRSVNLKEATLRWQDQVVRASGQVMLDQSPVAIDVTVDGEDLKLATILEAAAPDVAADGTVSLHATLTGAAADPRVAARLTGNGLIAYGEKFGSFDAGVTYANSYLELESLVLSKPQASGVGTLTARGWADLQDRLFHLEADSNNLQLESLRVSGQSIQGELQLKADAGGSFDDPAGELSAGLKSESLGNVTASATVEKRLVRFAAAADPVILDSFGVPGTVEFKTSGSVPFGEWRRVEARVTAPSIDVTIAGQHVTNDGAVELEVLDGLLQARAVSLKSGGGTVSASGAMALFDETSPGLKIAGEIPLSLAQQFFPADYPACLDGVATLAGTVGGGIQNPLPDVSVSVETATLTLPSINEPVSGIRLQARVRRDAVEVEKMEAAFSGGTLAATGRFTFEPAAYQAKLSIDQVDLAPVAGSQVPETISIPISATLEARGESLELDDLSASAVIQELALIAQQGEIRQTQPTRIALANQRLTLERFQAKGKLTEIDATGTYDLRTQTLDAKLDGELDTGLLTRNSAELAMAGIAVAHVSLSGPVAEPLVRGTVAWRDGQLAVTEPALGLDDINFLARFDGRKVEIERLAADLNGGRVRASGSFEIEGSKPANVNLELTARNVFLDYPSGFQTLSTSNLTLKSAGRNLLLGGSVIVQDGSYREPYDITQLIRSARRQGSLLEERNELLESLRFDIQVRTRQPVVMDNNIGRVVADANVRLVGSPQRPGLTGRIELEEDGRIYFGGRAFQITNGVIDFTEENRIAPRFNLAAETRVSTYDITLKLTGDIDDIETSFSSEPSANQDQIMALLFTGSIDNAGRGSAYAQTQMLTLFGSSLTGGISNRLRNTFGLSEFRVDPGLISPDSDPTARLTIGQNLTPDFRITYSTNLADSQDQIWAAEYSWRRRFLARYFRQTDQSNRVELRFRFRFGGGPKTGDFSSRRSRRETRIGELKILGEPILDEKTILSKLRLKPGGKFDAIKAQDGLRRLRTYYAKLGYAEVRIRQDRRPVRDPDREEGDERVVDLEYMIEPGQKVRFIFEGAPVSGSKETHVAQRWQQGLIDQQRIRTTSLLLRDELVQDGYADAKVTAEIKPGDTQKTVVYEIDRGQKYGHPDFDFGAVPKDLAADLRHALRREKLDREVKSHPDQVAIFLRRYLEQLGYLAAAVEAPIVTATGDHDLMASVPVELGPPFVVGDVRFEGIAAFEADILRRAMIVEGGESYVPEDRYTLANRVQRYYWNAGYRKAEVDLRENPDLGNGTVDLAVVVDEKQQLLVENVDVDGLSVTKESYLRRRLDLEEGDVLSAAKVNSSRRNLLDSGAYNLIDFTYPPFGDIVAPPAPQPITMNIQVREPKPYRLDLGGTYDTERGPGVLTDFSTINVLGEARTLGLRTLVDQKRQEYRVYFSQPFLGSKRINTTSTLFLRNERDLGAFDARSRGLTVQQYIRLGPRFDFIYGYKYTTAVVISRTDGFRLSGSSAPLISSLIRDSRDNVLDATKGTFTSHSVEYAPGALGGDVKFFRYYAQGFKYFGLTKPVQMPFEGEVRRSRFVFATGARFGAANTIADTIILPVDRFFGGGGTTVRGYKQNTLGPTVAGEPVGGLATMVFNNELRFPLFKFFDGAAFFDAGNVWERPSNISFTDLRMGTGFGVRIRNPFIIVRLDYGFKVGRRPGESAGAFFFSIGQAF